MVIRDPDGKRLKFLTVARVASDAAARGTGDAT
jgi:hypothetical protein